MQFRRYQAADQAAVLELIQQTIRTINIHDYTAHQVAVWSAIDENQWANSLTHSLAFVVMEQAQIIGFADLTPNGYIDRFYIHADYQRRGVGQALLKKIEAAIATTRYSVAASITARPFFESQGYQVVRENQVTLRAVMFTNYLMEKVLT
ncbi:GNAT family N-acetyltransferase [Enterococcus sp. LJL98]